ncbi:MAG: hypothetical protein ACI9B7_001448 [Oleispira sp.]|jgi:hypothetical protein
MNMSIFIKPVLLGTLFSLVACAPAAINVKPNDAGNYWTPKNKLSTIFTTKTFGCGLFSSEEPKNSNIDSPSALVNYTIDSNGIFEKVSASNYLDGLTEKDLKLWVNLMNFSGFSFYDSVTTSPQPIIVSERFYLKKSDKHCK